ncbi:MAG: hypothetical protein ACYC35_20095 [Pirellulales bacterium]
MKLGFNTLLAFFAVAWLAAGSASAEDRPLDFLRALQERGYGEMAVQYIDRLQNRADLPAEVRELLELELAKSLRIAAAETVNTDEAKQWLAGAKTHLEAFLKQSANHPEAAAAHATLGDLAFDDGQALVRQARASTDKDRQGKDLAEARAAFEESRPHYTQSVAIYQARLATMIGGEAPKNGAAAKERPGVKTTRRAGPVNRQAVAERQDVEYRWLEARFKLALVDYNVAQTYAKLDDPGRKAALQQGAKAFDAIYQQYRTYEVGLYAHMWHGKTTDDLGDLQTALDIYDEVLANAPDPTQRERETGMEPLFAQVEYFRLQILLKQKKRALFTSEASDWLKMNRAARQTDGYQGIALEVAKAQIQDAEKAAGPQRSQLYRQAILALTEVAKFRGEHQQEAILLRRECLGKGGENAEASTFDEAVAVGDSAAGGSQWAEAASGYAQALKLVGTAKKKDPEQVCAVRYRLAHALFMSGKTAEAMQAAESLARQAPTSASAPSAAALAVSAALNLYVAAKDKAPALEQLVKVADFTVKTWPARAEADDARMALGQGCLVRGETDKAIAVFEQVNSKSDRYPIALHLAGQSYWRGYLLEKAKPDASRDAAALAANRAKALERLTSSLDLQRKTVEAGKPLPRAVMETQLLLAEVHLEGGQADKAAPLLQPLVDAFKGAKNQSLDNLTLRTFVAAVRAYVALADLAKAGEVATVLTESGGDIPEVNSVLVGFARQLHAELKAAQGVVEGAGVANTDPKAVEAAQKKLTSTQDILVKVLEQLAKRQQNTLAGMVFIGDTCAELRMSDKAREQYQRILKKAADDPALTQTYAKALTRTRAQLVGLLRSEGKFDEAGKEVDVLIKDNPRALEPLMEKGRILQAQAETDPKHYDAAVGHWTKLRTMLARMQRKPPEYYEVIYNTAFCLAGQSDRSGDKTKAAQSEQLLKSTLVLSPKLSGPDMVAKYKALLDAVLKMQGKVTKP